MTAAHVMLAALLVGLAGWFGTAGGVPPSRRLQAASGTNWRTRVRQLPSVRVRGVRSFAMVAGGAAAAFAVGAIPATVAAGACYVLARRRRTARRARDALRQQAEDVPALRALAAELQCGLTPGAALQAAGTSPAQQPGGIRRRMLAAADVDALGGDAAASLAADAEPGSPAAALGAAWGVSRRSGASLAGPATRIADGAAAQLRIAREADAALASARSSARLLSALPFAGVALGALSGTGSLRTLLTTGVGQLCLLVGVGLDLAGLAWLDRLARDAAA